MPCAIGRQVSVQVAILGIPLNIERDTALEIVNKIAFLIYRGQLLNGFVQFIFQDPLCRKVYSDLPPASFTEHAVNLFCNIASISTCNQPTGRIKAE